MKTEQEKAELKAKLAKLRESFARLKAACSYGARIHNSTLDTYAKQVATLEDQIRT